MFLGHVRSVRRTASHGRGTDQRGTHSGRRRQVDSWLHGHGLPELCQSPGSTSHTTDHVRPIPQAGRGGEDLEDLVFIGLGGADSEHRQNRAAICYLYLAYLCVFDFLCSVVFGQVGWPTWDVVQWNRGWGCPFCWSSHSESQRQMWKSRYPEMPDICIYSHKFQWKILFDFNIYILN